VSDAPPGAGGTAPRAAGIGLRAAHHAAVLATRPAVGWFEAHAENYFGGGPARRTLLEVRARWPVALHGVGLSLGGTDPLDAAHLRALAALVRDVDPAIVSEHACWSAHGGEHFNDLLPLPYTDEALRHLAARVACVQDALGRRILVENVSSYVRFRDADLDEAAFLAALVRESGCGLLLDVNNVHVSAVNHGFDPHAYLAALPADAVGELHVAGHARTVHDGRELLVDTHDGPVADAVWALHDAAVARFPHAPTLVEWDAQLPPLATLVAEAAHAYARRERVLGLAA
jgi:uncharacterized protein (UPF0276 family)